MNEETVGSYFQKNFSRQCAASRCLVSYQNLLLPKKDEVIYVMRNANGSFSLQTTSVVTIFGRRKRLNVTSSKEYKTTLMLCYAEKILPETLIGLN